MATLTPDLVLIVDGANPDQVGYTAEKMGSSQSISARLKALVHFTIPEELAHKRIYEYQLGVYFEDYQITGTEYYGFANCQWLTSGFEAGVTYNTAPATVGFSDSIRPNYPFSGYYYTEYVRVDNSSLDAQYFWSNLTNGIEVWGNRNFWTSINQNQVKLFLSAGSEDRLPTVSGSPSGGYLPKQTDNLFSWAVTMPEYTLKGWEITGQAFEWKKAEDENWTHIDVTGNSYTVPGNTFTGGDIVWRAAVSVTDDSRTETIYSNEYTINTTEPLGSARLRYPINVITDGSRPIQLSWRYLNTSGRLQNGADIQWGVAGGNWQNLGSVTGYTSTYTVPADFFPAGTVYWRVRVYNQDGAVGAWSMGVTFTNIAAPPAPILTSNGVPYTTITWQSEGQEAWQLTVDGKEYGTRYGYDRSFTLPEPLEDGQHTAAVIVQNEFGLWSQPGTLIFDILNQPGGEVTLTGAFGTDADLSWTVSSMAASSSHASDWARGGMSSTSGGNTGNARRLRTAATTGLPSNVRGIRAAEGYEFVLYGYDGNGEYLGQWTGEGFEKAAQDWTTDEFLDPLYAAGASAIRVLARRADNAEVYVADGVNIRYLVNATREPDGFQVLRDGVRIGHTTAREFTDRIALGEHNWHVVAMLPGGYYTKSNVVTGTITIEEPVIGTLSGSGEWLKLTLSDRSATVQEFSSERTVTYRHFAGAEYPVLEMAPFKDKTGRYDVSFADPAEAAAFEALFGQIVILKSRRGNVIVGPLATLSKRETDFYTAFTFTIQQIHWEEIVDDS